MLLYMWDPRSFHLSFFFQAEDGIRDGHVTGVQTCALPISRTCPRGCDCNDQQLIARCDKSAQLDYVPHTLNPAVKELYLSHNNIRGIKSAFERSEERRVGKECRCRELQGE